MFFLESTFTVEVDESGRALRRARPESVQVCHLSNKDAEEVPLSCLPRVDGVNRRLIDA